MKLLIAIAITRASRRARTRSIGSCSRARGLSLIFDHLTVFNGEVLFGGVDAAGGNGLFVHNGQSVSEISINGAYFGGINLSDLTAFNNEVLFNGFDAAGRQGLWVTDGTTAGTHEIAVKGAASGGLNPSDLTVFNHHEVLFDGVDAAGKLGLWVTDGTTTGTHEITGISGANSNAVTRNEWSKTTAKNDTIHASAGLAGLVRDGQRRRGHCTFAALFFLSIGDGPRPGRRMPVTAYFSQRALMRATFIAVLLLLPLSCVVFAAPAVSEDTIVGPAPALPPAPRLCPTQDHWPSRAHQIRSASPRY
jgi:ELWxxDGT repeat protein